MRLTVVHAVASLFGHNRLLSLFYSPQRGLKSSRQDEFGGPLHRVH